MRLLLLSKFLETFVGKFPHILNGSVNVTTVLQQESMQFANTLLYCYFPQYWYGGTCCEICKMK